MKDLNGFIEKNMVLVPGGNETIRRFKDSRKWISSNYRMSIPSKGKNQEQTEESIHIDDFYVSTYPVTHALYTKYTSGRDENNQLPKVNVSWLDALEFCNLLSQVYGLEPVYDIDQTNQTAIHKTGSNGFRLLTDAEWQYACRGGLLTYQYGPIDEIAWYNENSNQTLHPVGQLKANGYGLYDMLGNVWEWCWDLYNIETYDNYRIFRGGSYGEEKRICGATTRRKSLPSFTIDDLGFRLAKSI